MKDCTVFAKTDGMPRDEWLKTRRCGIGGSDAGAIMGFNKYVSPHEVYISKVTESEKDLSGNEAVYWGTVLEPVVAEEFEKRSGLRVRRVNAVLQSKKYPFMLANVDRMVIGENAVLECKTANQHLSADWDGDEVPPAYICQCQHYMAVTGAQRCYIACLVGGQRFVYKPIDRDDEFIGYLIDAERDFWENHVLKNIPPPMTGMACDSEYLNAAYSSGGGGAVMMTSDIDKAAERYIDICGREKEIKAEKEKYANIIKQYMEESETAVSERFRADWKSVRSVSADIGMLKEKYPDIYAKCAKEKITRRFILRKKDN